MENKLRTNISGLPTGFRQLDDAIGGWQPSELVIIGGRPAMGKTAFAQSMIKRMAVDMHTPVAIFSLEMSTSQWMKRFVQVTCEISDKEIRKGRFDSDKSTQIDDRISQMTEAPIYIDDSPALSVSELSTKSRMLIKEHGVKVIIIDYVMLMNGGEPACNNRAEELTYIVSKLKELAIELDIPIIALSQMNGNNKEDKGPMLSDLRFFQVPIEQYADKVCFIYRPEYYRIYEVDGKDMMGKAELIVHDLKKGNIKTVVLRFVKEQMRFED